MHFLLYCASGSQQGDILHPQGHLERSGGIFGCCHLGVGATDESPQQKLPNPKRQLCQIEKPCPRGWAGLNQPCWTHNAQDSPHQEGQPQVL